MSATLLHAPATPSGPLRWRAHRYSILAGAWVAALAALAIAGHGFHYYALPYAARTLSSQHDELKPGGTLGHTLGIAGGVLLLLVYLYPLRKHWTWLSRKGQTKHWLDYHILMGLTAPMLVTFHSAFKLRGIAGVAYWSMIAVVLSGIVGRYFYSRIPRKLGTIEMSLEEMEKLREALAAQIEEQDVLTREELASLLALPAMDEVQQMPLLKALVVVIELDLRRYFGSWRLRRKAAAHVVNNAELAQALAVVGRQAALSKDILFLTKMRRLFTLWHVVHKPFSYSLAVLASLHVLVAAFLGYF